MESVIVVVAVALASTFLWSYWQAHRVPAAARPRCTRCGRSSAECATLVSGPGVMVCDVCIGDLASRPPPSTGWRGPCAFCRKDVQPLMEPTGLALCTACFDTTREIVDERRMRRDVSKALEKNPDDSEALSVRADQRSEAGDYAGALADCDRVLVLDPGSLRARITRSFCLVRLERYAEALAECDAGFAHDPPPTGPFAAVLYNNRARALLGLGRALEALEEIEKALAIKPDLPRFLENRELIRRALD